ncbi:MAG: 4Fe-4S binding protein [Firmicutes bacterium]|nr:4Fe-4S binding protein [Dethiobacter sp.]MBS3889245.1 4Fe-4S binding protein [Bacillota bacterium]MBS4054598.1 4Fe-4S binding protein [Thermaerobacter sp.]
MTVITSLRAKCKDCHRCIRVCPVKAISLRNGQAQVVAERCITCGLCVTVCPQKAKAVTSQAHALATWQQDRVAMVASLAPSFPAAFPHLDPRQIIAGIKALGFSHVEETSYAAAAVARHYQGAVASLKHDFLISSCCPVVVNLVEMYYPELIPNLAATVSPMILHGEKLKQRYGEAKVVFIGPCSGKLAEAARKFEGATIDLAITFKQLEECWQLASIDPARLEPVPSDLWPRAPRLYPLSRGILEASGLSTPPARRTISISGLESCLETFRDLASGILKPSFVEALACREGCVGGTEMPCTTGAMARRDAVERYHELYCASEVAETQGHGPLHWEVRPYIFTPRLPSARIVTEEEIRAVLLQIGKDSIEDERNCGGCGYHTCREKAVATLQGFAELEMCVPFMRAKFESLSHLVVDSSPNGVVIVNSDITIHQFNAEAERMFNPCGKPTKGAHLADFLDPSDFVHVAMNGQVLYRRVEYDKLQLTTRQVIYALPEYNLIVGIVTDVTDEEQRKKELEGKHQETIQRATAVIRNQMKLAQEIAGLLGEATAETKATLLDLITSLADESGAAK